LAVAGWPTPTPNSSARSFAQIAATTNTKGGPQSASATQHLRTTLRTALNLAVREGLLDCNPARHVEITGYQQPHGDYLVNGVSGGGR